MVNYLQYGLREMITQFCDIRMVKDKNENITLRCLICELSCHTHTHAWYLLHCSDLMTSPSRLIDHATSHMHCFDNNTWNKNCVATIRQIVESHKN